MLALFNIIGTAAFVVFAVVCVLLVFVGLKVIRNEDKEHEAFMKDRRNG